MSVTETNIEVLKSRVANGLTYCNDICQKLKVVPDNEYQALSDKLVTGVKKLDELNHMLNLQGYQECVFGRCRFEMEKFCCFVCSRTIPAEPQPSKQTGLFPGESVE